MLDNEPYAPAPTLLEHVLIVVAEVLSDLLNGGDETSGDEE